MLSGDESDVTIESEAGEGAGQAAQGGDKRPSEGGAEEKKPEVELLKTKRARLMKPFAEDLLVGQDGLPVIYNEFPMKCGRAVATGQEGKYLKQLISAYKEWAFQLHPGLSFQDVLLKCDSLSSKGALRSYMVNLRDRERDRFMSEVLLPNYVDKLAAQAALEQEERLRAKEARRAKRAHRVESPSVVRSEPAEVEVPAEGSPRSSPGSSGSPQPAHRLNFAENPELLDEENGLADSESDEDQGEDEGGASKEQGMFTTNDDEEETLCIEQQDAEETLSLTEGHELRAAL